MNMSKEQQFQYDQTVVQDVEVPEVPEVTYYSFWYDYARAHNGANRVHADKFAQAHKFEVPKLTI